MFWWDTRWDKVCLVEQTGFSEDCISICLWWTFDGRLIARDYCVSPSECCFQPRWPRPLSEPCLRYLRTRLLTWSIHRKGKQIDPDSWFRQRKTLQHFIELFPVETVLPTPAIEPLEQQPLHSFTKPYNAPQVIGDPVVVVMTLQLGLGCLPQFSGFQRSGSFQPLLENFVTIQVTIQLNMLIYF